MLPIYRTACLLALLCTALLSSTRITAQQPCSASRTAWTASWGSAQQVPEPANALQPTQLRDVTLRQVVHLSIGGTRLRVRLSNAFGTAPLTIDAAHVALAVRPGSPALRAGSDRVLTFAGSPQVSIPPGAEYLSDPLDGPLSAFADVAVSLQLPQVPAVQTGHPGARTTTFLVHGDSTASVSLDRPETVEHWYFLSGVEVSGSCNGGLVVAFGDSITDGHGATTDGNDRWPDLLARRLAQPLAAPVAAVNAGIGGNHLLTDGLGPNALARFDRDVLARPGVRTVIVLEGINDLGALSLGGEQPVEAHTRLVAALLASYRQIVERAHAQGVRVVGATLTPDAGSAYYHPAAANEADRQAINRWIRTPGNFDSVVDFDAIIRDPGRPDRMLPAYDSGDHLHPSPAGYAAMANGIPLADLVR